MKEQNFKNHSRLVFGYHFITYILWLVLLTLALINLKNSIRDDSGILEAIMFITTAIILLCVIYYVRNFALKAQDRAIRIEEKFRYYILTGKTQNEKLNLSQIIALRFSSDEELTELSAIAAEKNLDSNEIKKMIKNWKKDIDRV